MTVTVICVYSSEVWLPNKMEQQYVSLSVHPQQPMTFTVLLCMLRQEVVVGGSTGVTLGEEGSAILYIQNDGALEVEYDIKDTSEVYFQNVLHHMYV